MSSDYYFHKLKHVLCRLNTLVNTDEQYQVLETRDKRRCQAVERLNGMLVAYISVYNDTLECSQNNLQVQKAKYLRAVLLALVDRILELKHDLRNLEKCQVQFISKGAIQQHLTVDDAELLEIPIREERDDQIQIIITNAISTAKEKIRQKELELAQGDEESVEEEAVAWWEDDEQKSDHVTGDKFIRYDEVEKISEETLKIRGLVALIQAHEKTRLVTRNNLYRIQRRVIWEKELLGTLAPQSKPALRERAARLIQQVSRKFMEVKRTKLLEQKRKELLGITQCGEYDYSQRQKLKEIKERRNAIFIQFDNEWKKQRAQMKDLIYKSNHDELQEHCRDTIRDWFQHWYQKIGIFHNIPHTNQGGTLAIFREEIPSPEEWYEEYKDYMAKSKKKENKSAQQIKYEKQAALREQKQMKLKEHKEKKLQELLERKIMKNPNMHPGFKYPESKKFHKLIEALDNYHSTWGGFDEEESLEAKERNIEHLDKEDVYGEVKMEIATEVEPHMKEELKKLNTALKKDYENAEEQMPEPMPTKKQRRLKKKKDPNAPDNAIVKEKMEFLAEIGVLKEYPRTKLEDFLGDHNVTGDDCRCLNKEAHPYAGEIRSIWWERCRKVTHGFHRTLVVGPPGSGRTTLVHAMASANDAILFELDPSTMNEDMVTPALLQIILDALVFCARVAQPSLIYIRNVHNLYLKKKYQKDALPNAELMKRYSITKLFKLLHKTDHITVVASCCEPWLTTPKLIKKFPEVLLVPDTSYSVVAQMLNHWIVSNRCLPRELDVHTLALSLRGHSFVFLKSILQRFVEPDYVVKMAAYGLSAKEILEYVINTGVIQPDYELYLKWYSNNTTWGKKERRQLEKALEFKAAEEKYAEKELKKNKAKQQHAHL